MILIAGWGRAFSGDLVQAYQAYFSPVLQETRAGFGGIWRPQVQQFTPSCRPFTDYDARQVRCSDLGTSPEPDDI